ncbi:hypothetical protein WICMUC_000277 [Wickerhamomyces mucosus]|uniref:Peptidase A1 domain-containing protein n=1 Tax=Wickerhamomyces mucosus TaxID=1378264 RepID=A0A9P8Q0C1_9ASCO|nr:hypothetical protein WICMUC_000277 [Wickerhamomyces mucosus]
MVSISKLSFALLSLITQLSNAKNLGYHSLDFQVTQGKNFKDSLPRSQFQSQLIKREIDGIVDMEIENQSTFYSVSLKIGSQDEEVIVLVDTGSSDLWVTSSSNPYCSSSSSSSKKFRNLNDTEFLNGLNSNKEEDGNLLESYSLNNKASTKTSSVSSSVATINCNKYGTFDSSKSSTFSSNNTDFYILYGDSTFALGQWGTDTLVIDGLEVKDLSFAVANSTNSSVGVLGIGLEGLETTNAGALAGSNPYTYANLPVKLVQDGLIERTVYSLYLNDSSSSSGSVLFGGVDHSKYSGDLITVPIINTLESSGYSTAIEFQITLSGISIGSESVTSNQYAALLDSGTTLTYAPSSIISSIASAINAKYSSDYGYYVLTCPTSSSSNVTFNFQGVEIQVPLDDLLLQVSSSSLCVLAVLDSGDSSFILGDSFLRSAYVVYDLDNLEISLAQSNLNSDSENIDVVSASTIPSATQAASYSSTFDNSGTSTDGSEITFNIGTGTSVSSTTTKSKNTSTVQTIVRSSSKTTTTGTGTGTTGSSSSSTANVKNSGDRLSNQFNFITWVFGGVSFILFMI